MSGYESLISTLTLPDPNDRHVVAAALVAHAPTIVTLNRNDFPDSALTALGIRAVSPDSFVHAFLDDPQTAPAVVAASRRCRANQLRPPRSPADFLTFLQSLSLRDTATALQPFVDHL